MTIDERAQLVEDIRVAGTKRREIAERAQLDKDFDIAGGKIRILRLVRACHHLAGDGYYALTPQGMRAFMNRRIALGVEHYLCETGAVPEIDEHDRAMVPPPLHPAI